MKSHAIEIGDLSPARYIEKRFYAKPKVGLYILCIISVLFFIMVPIWGWMGFIVALYSLICLFQFPDIPLAELNDEYLIIYQKHDTAYLLYWNELYRWTYKKDRDHDLVYFVMEDNSVHELPFYAKRKIQTYLQKYASKKEG